MRRLLRPALAVAAIMLAAAPSQAQEEGEPLTTWRINMIDVRNGGLERWQEIIINHLLPAYETAGLEPPQLHWVIDNEEWDMMVIHVEHGGLDSLDEAARADIATITAAMVEREGSQEAVDALFAELRELEERTATTVTKSHQ